MGISYIPMAKIVYVCIYVRNKSERRHRLGHIRISDVTKNTIVCTCRDGYKLHSNGKIVYICRSIYVINYQCNATIY